MSVYLDKSMCDFIDNFLLVQKLTLGLILALPFFFY